MILTLTLILLGCIAFMFAFHFLMLPISAEYRRRLKRKYYTDKFFDNGRWSVYLTNEKSLLMSFNHYSKEGTEFLYDDSQFARCFHIVIGGLSIFFRYGHKFLPYEPGKDDSTWYLGFYSVDGEKFWSNIWVGHRIYDNPFRHCKFQGCWIYDLDSNSWIPKDELDERTQYDHTQYPVALKLEKAEYVTKAGEHQTIDEIVFWIERRTWSSPIVKFLGLAKIWNKTLIDVEFDIVKGEGIGKNRGEWKGGVYQSACIRSFEDEDFEIWMNRVEKHPHEVSRFKRFLEYRITQWLETSRKY